MPIGFCIVNPLALIFKILSTAGGNVPGNP